VSGRYSERAGSLGSELPRDLAEVFRVLEDALGDPQDHPSRLGHIDDALAMADEDIHAQFVFQLADLLADPGLGGMECFGGLGQVQSPLGHLSKIP
jgi:hypothetical protein